MCVGRCGCERKNTAERDDARTHVVMVMLVFGKQPSDSHQTHELLFGVSIVLTHWWQSVTVKQQEVLSAKKQKKKTKK